MLVCLHPSHWPSRALQIYILQGFYKYLTIYAYGHDVFQFGFWLKKGHKSSAKRAESHLSGQLVPKHPERWFLCKDLLLKQLVWSYTSFWQVYQNLMYSTSIKLLCDISLLYGLWLLWDDYYRRLNYNNGVGRLSILLGDFKAQGLYSLKPFSFIDYFSICCIERKKPNERVSK